MVVRSLPVRWPICSAVRLSSLRQALEGDGRLDGVEVFALDVLDQGDFEEAVVGDVLDDDRDLVRPASLAARQRRSPATSW